LKRPIADSQVAMLRTTHFFDSFHPALRLRFTGAKLPVYPKGGGSGGQVRSTG